MLTVCVQYSVRSSKLLQAG
uniref:Uncharacterized protein n=1 Tax=Rhizophora mucronata TaxID=61149 RepID=A0A2P2N9R9_RHIMU